jgi:hypothetical protein
MKDLGKSNPDFINGRKRSWKGEEFELVCTKEKFINRMALIDKGFTEPVIKRRQ